MRKTEEILRSLLHQKGMDSQEDISEFLSDRPQKTYDPFLPVSYTHLKAPKNSPAAVTKP